MSKKGGRKSSRTPNRGRVRTRPTVRERPALPLKVAVVTYPATHVGGGITVQADSALVKAAVLYADEIELISLGAAMIGAMASLAQGGSDALLDVMRSLDESTMQRISGGAGFPVEALDLIPLIQAFGRTPEGQEAGLGVVLDEYEAMAAQTTGELREVAERMIEDSGAAELIPCIDAGILTLSDAGLNNSSDSDEMVNQWIDIIHKRFRDGKTRLLFDDSTGDLVSSMLREGMIEHNDLGIKHAGEAAVGSGFVARLPAFPQAPIDELLDLRRDLQEPLVRYRSAVMRLADELPRIVGPEVEGHIDDLWRTDVSPAIQEIELSLADHALVREISLHALTDVRRLLLEGAGLFIGLSQLSGLGNWLSATIAGAGPTIDAAASGVRSAYEGRRDARRHDWFYLYEANRQLDRG